jgi:DNA-binding Lrp family transcriptional regulator
MAKGFVLISIEPGREMETYEALYKLEEVKEITPLLGDIDFILLLIMNTEEEIATMVIKKIRTVPGVVSTKTLIQDNFVKHFEELM